MTFRSASMKKPTRRLFLDPHYEDKHSDSVTDEIILALVQLLNGGTYRPVDTDEDGFRYFVNDRLEHQGKFYKLIWLVHEQQFFVGIVNAYRR